MSSITTTEIAQLQPDKIGLSSSHWKQTNRGHYVRPLDGLEAFFTIPHTLGAEHKRQHWAMSTGIRIRTQRPNFAEDVRAAWISLRYRHPVLATKVEDGRFVYRIADEDELSRWLKETFIVHSSTMAGSELYGTTTRPLKQVICNVLPQTQEIIIQCMHLNLDGLGGVTLFDNLLRLLSNPQPAPWFGDEAKNLLPPFSVLSQPPIATPQQQTRWEQSLETWLGAKATPLRLAAKNMSEVPGRSRMLSLTFSESSTDDIVLSSRKFGLTVTHAIQAAICLASRIHSGNTECKTFPTLAIYNSREYCTELAPDASTLVGLHLTATPITIKLGTFMETASSARELFVGDHADKYALAVASNFTDTMPKILATPPPMMPAAPQLSSFGNIDPRLQKTYADKVTKKDIEVEDFWCTLDQCTAELSTGVWTFRGKLRMHVGYNEIYHEEGSIRRWLALVKGELEQGLGLGLEVED